MAAQNIQIKINYVKGKIDKTQQNTRCRLCIDRDEIINHIISECRKLAQKEYKSRHEWVGKMVINWELCMKLKFYHTNKRYMYNPSSVLGNEMRSYPCDFEIQMDYLISASPSNNKQKIIELAELWTHKIKLKEK